MRPRASSSLVRVKFDFAKSTPEAAAGVENTVDEASDFCSIPELAQEMINMFAADIDDPDEMGAIQGRCLRGDQQGVENLIFFNALLELWSGTAAVLSTPGHHPQLQLPSTCRERVGGSALVQSLSGAGNATMEQIDSSRSFEARTSIHGY